MSSTAFVSFPLLIASSNSGPLLAPNPPALELNATTVGLGFAKNDSDGIGCATLDANGNGLAAAAAEDARAAAKLSISITYK